MKENKPTNETGKNPETEQEKEVLPSFFQTLKTSYMFHHDVFIKIRSSFKIVDANIQLFL